MRTPMQGVLVVTSINDHLVLNIGYALDKPSFLRPEFIKEYIDFIIAL